MFRVTGVAGFVLIVLVASLAPAQAQATRTWVSGVGDDANPCSRTAPCKTFAGAISKTAAGGIISCIDPGGFGALTITKAITVDCTNTMAGVLAVGTNGININAAATDNVTLRGLNIEGGNGLGLIGINYIRGGALHVERCRIFGFRTGAATGIHFAVPNGVTAELFVSDTTVVDNGNGPSAGAMVVRANGAATARVTINRVQLHNNSSGLRVDGTSTTNGVISLLMRDSTVNGNTNTAISVVANSTGAGDVFAMLNNVAAVGNQTALSADGGLSRVFITRFSTLANTTGASAVNSGSILSYSDNHFFGNLVTNGAPTGTRTPQ